MLSRPPFFTRSSRSAATSGAAGRRRRRPRLELLALFLRERAVHPARRDRLDLRHDHGHDVARRHRQDDHRRPLRASSESRSARAASSSKPSTRVPAARRRGRRPAPRPDSSRKMPASSRSSRRRRASKRIEMWCPSSRQPHAALSPGVPNTEKKYASGSRAKRRPSARSTHQHLLELHDRRRRQVAAPAEAGLEQRVRQRPLGLGHLLDGETLARMHLVRNEVPATAALPSRTRTPPGPLVGRQRGDPLVRGPRHRGGGALRGDCEAADPERDDHRRESKAFHDGNPIKYVRRPRPLAIGIFPASQVMGSEPTHLPELAGV